VLGYEFHDRCTRHSTLSKTKHKKDPKGQRHGRRYPSKGSTRHFTRTTIAHAASLLLPPFYSSKIFGPNAKKICYFAF